MTYIISHLVSMFKGRLFTWAVPKTRKYFIGDDVDKSSTETFLLFLYLFILVN
ncbi:hypothetical protein C427_0068 [Paraglaciecola psychrophila 170]|uniref:Uncharacterized protein n=1 Tax=Paraglaciecola psychrophila 170 TaxID=1129794 RepID=K7AGA1_9ALTE|nr:hypothetical protein C427_0068 [Paraglaciecola psychrophila 170]GAC39663.1 hypothetical protein GPSY_4052 [Paraglaciecola psychrophila 170]